MSPTSKKKGNPMNTAAKFRAITSMLLAIMLSTAAGAALAVDMPANYTRLDWIESDVY